MTEPPTNIAALGALVSEDRESASEKQHGFLDSLTPWDTEKQREAKLNNWTFSLAPNGRIVGDVKNP